MLTAVHDPTTDRLETQIKWYDDSSASSKRWYHGLKVAEMVAAAAVPISLVISGDRILPAIFGGAVVVLEGMLQLGQFHSNWIGYRSTCEALKHEKYLYLGHAGPYAGVTDAHSLLAARLEELVSREHARWVDARAQQHTRG